MDADIQGGEGTPSPVPAQPSAMIDYKALALAMRDAGLAMAQPTNPPATQPHQAIQTPSTPQTGRVTIDKARLDEYLELERKAREAEDHARKRDEELALKRGEYDTVIKAREKETAEAKARLEAEEKRFRSATRDRELSLALSGKPLVPGAAEQIMKLWRDDFEAHPEGEAYRVLSRDYQPVADEVARRLAQPEYGHFILPTSRGGTGNPTGGQGTTQTPAANAKAPEPSFSNLGEAIIDAFKTVKKQRTGTFGPTGLRPTR